MSTRHPYFQDLASLLGNSAALHTLYILFDRTLADPADTRGLLLWWGLLLLSYLLMAVLIHGLHVQKNIFLIPAAALLAQLALTLAFGDGAHALLACLCLLFLWGVPLYRALSFLLNPVSADQRMTDFETTVLVLLLTVLVCSGQALPGEALLPTAAASLLLLFALSSQRTSGIRGRGRLSGRLLPVLLLLGVLEICLLFLNLLASRASVGLQSFTAAVLSLGQRIGRAVNRFLEWLFSLLPAGNSSVSELPPPETEAFAESAQMDAGGTLSPAPFLVLFLVIGAAALIFLSRRRPSLPSFSSERAARQRLPRVRGRIRERIAQMLRRLRFQFTALLQRDTPAGLLVWVERRLRSRGCARRVGETSRQFLARAEESLPHCQAELRLLAGSLDRQYYNAEPPLLSPTRIRQMRRAFGRDLACRSEAEPDTSESAGRR